MTSDAEASEVRRRRRSPARLSTVLLVIVTALGSTAIAYLTITQDSRPILVATADLPAFHQITPSDLRAEIRAVRDIPAGALIEQDLPVGRYTIVATPAKQPILKNHLGPRLAPTTLDGAIVAIPATPETTLGTRLGRGDTIDLILSPNGNGRSSGIRISGVVVLDITPPPHEAVVVAMNSGDVDRFLLERGTSTITVTRISAHPGPH